MRSRLKAVFVVLASLLCCMAAANAHVCGREGVKSQVQTDTSGVYTAVVKKDEARFRMPVPARDVWRWRVKETGDNAREYMMAVGVTNGTQEFSFGFFLWKRAGSAEGAGKLSSLLAAGQKSLFARTAQGSMVIVRDATVSVKQDRGLLVITVNGRRNVERIFSARPAEVTFSTIIPGEAPVMKSVPVTYEN